MTSPLSPIDPSRACSGCGMTPDAWATDDAGCHWPDGQVGCYSAFDRHYCPRCNAALPPPSPDPLEEWIAIGMRLSEAVGDCDKCGLICRTHVIDKALAIIEAAKSGTRSPAIK